MNSDAAVLCQPFALTHRVSWPLMFVSSTLSFTSFILLMTQLKLEATYARFCGVSPLSVDQAEFAKHLYSMVNA